MNTKASSLWRDYLSLTKPTICLLVVVTALPGLLFTWPFPSLSLSLGLLGGLWLVSASAAVLNQYFERDLDKTMKRTAGRALPGGRVPKKQAMLWSLFLGVAGEILLILSSVSLLAPIISFLSHILYGYIYTLWLKPRTPQNIVLGGIAGASGPLIAYSAVTGHLAWPAWALFLIVCLWTPPHFWSLALKYKEDYETSRTPMYPVIYGEDRTRRAIFFYTIPIWPLLISLYWNHFVSGPFFLVSFFLTGKFSYKAGVMYFTKNHEKAMDFFYYSCFYILGLFSFLAVERLVVFALKGFP